MTSFKDISRQAEEARLSDRDPKGKLTPRAPEVRQNAGVHYFRWTDLQLAVRVDRIREDSHHVVSAEMTIQALPEGHLHQARLNLTSTRARTDVVRFLATRHEGIDWDAIIEQVAVAVLRSHREGEPVVRLADVVIPERVQFRVDPLIVEQAANLIYGYGGLGKSLVAAYLSVTVDRGVIGDGMTAEPGNVLYLDYETDKETTARRFRQIEHGLGLDEGSRVMYRFCHQPLTSEIEYLQRAVTEHDIQLVVVDSAGPACGGEPEAAASTILYFAALRSLRVATLTIAHRAKDAKGPGPFGSVYWTNYPRNIYLLKKAQEIDEQHISLALLHEKANDGKLHHPLGWLISFTPESITISRQNIKEVPEFEGERSIKDRVRDALAHGRMTPTALAEELGANERAIRQALTQGDGKEFIKIDSHSWGLRHPGEG